MFSLDSASCQAQGSIVKPTGIAFAGLFAVTTGLAGTESGLFNTGVDDSGVVCQPGSAALHYSLSGPLSNAVVRERHFSSPNHTWVAAPAGSAWIGPADSNPIMPKGNYNYKLEFQLGQNTGGIELSGEFSSDNKARIFLNGRDTGNHNAVVQYRGLTPFTITSGFVPGINSLEFRTTNSAARGHNPTGLLVANLKLTDRSVQPAPAPLVQNQTPVSDQPDFVASPAAIPLSHDDRFGYKLPDGIGLTHLVEASSDLVHWSPATNVVFYFKDLDSINFDERYYHFREK